ncbi:oxygen-insensitive NADPH nitroreductase [Alteribacter natronophilus]|uniref:oxygen-insensitive NADPH nitroreductase n=1 Tax=Alteribacter natronophilus TaxID=2583810 RepID=UPI00110D505E|nr:oxygen-insensitive NADPH nitroreductase [Alteribacter natronophilus]TMW73002.1 oxygen-insensitive NADPH nitroreductase [Alteribacter natronophilus]
MNPTIQTLLSHRSVRQFTEKKLSQEQINTIVECAQMASTSSFIQAYTIIGVKNPDTKARLAELAGNQPYVAANGHFFVFCADLNRHEAAGEMEQTDVTASLESTEKFLVASVDAALAAQNASIAAESMGLGICYIGGIRNNIEEAGELLGLPDRVVPLFGLAVGEPAKETSQKPRLPLKNVYHEEKYEQDREQFKKGLEKYNETISSYYSDRTGGKRSDRWTEQMSGMLSEPKRMHMKSYLDKKGFMKS